MDEDVPQWFDERFPPLSIFHGGRDYLILAEPLLKRLEEKEKNVRVMRVERLPLSEVCNALAFSPDGLTVTSALAL
jgi:lysosomal acid lipase/cholesteryl ester hydrolase